jgi:hypothetical protein
VIPELADNAGCLSPLIQYRLPKTDAVFFMADVSWAVAQTRITPPNNRYTPAQDVELGRQDGG